MAYCVASDLQLRFGVSEVAALLDRNNDAIEDVGVFLAALGGASSVIDGYIGARYTLPLAIVPILITDICCDLVRWKLWGANSPEEVTERYKIAIGLLRDIARGVAVLPAQDSTAEAGASIYVEANEQIFTADSLAGF